MARIATGCRDGSKIGMVGRLYWLLWLAFYKMLSARYFYLRELTWNWSRCTWKRCILKKSVCFLRRPYDMNTTKWFSKITLKRLRAKRFTLIHSSFFSIIFFYNCNKLLKKTFLWNIYSRPEIKKLPKWPILKFWERAKLW